MTNGRRRRIRGAVLHVANPLHLYCRVVDLGVPNGSARVCCIIYEATVFKIVRWLVGFIHPS